MYNHQFLPHSINYPGKAHTYGFSDVKLASFLLTHNFLFWS